MARKEFQFDFNEDADPVEELHRLRVAMTKHFKTIEAFMEYIRATPTAEEFLAQTAPEAQKPKPKATAKARTKAPAGTRAKKPAGQRNAARKRRTQKAISEK